MCVFDDQVSIGCFDRYSDVNVLETFIHLLQLISTSEQGVQALGNHCKLYTVLFILLNFVCGGYSHWFQLMNGIMIILISYSICLPLLICSVPDCAKLCGNFTKCMSAFIVISVKKFTV